METKEMMMSSAKIVMFGTLGSIPVLGPFISEINNEIGTKHLENRMNTIENRMKVLEATSINDNLAGDEHRFYVFKNILKSIIFSAIPEAVNLLCDALSIIGLNDDYQSAELHAEIILNLNSSDIDLLKEIKVKYESNQVLKMVKLFDFESKFHENEPIEGISLLQLNCQGEPYTYYAKSLLKFEQLNLLEMENDGPIKRVGNLVSNLLLTKLCVGILKYIETDSSK